jgi:hypothetical protein
MLHFYSLCGGEFYLLSDNSCNSTGLVIVIVEWRLIVRSL